MSSLRPLIAVALSGGVDSAVAATRLVEAGEPVIGLTMKTADAAPGPTGHQGCCGLQDVDDARRIARHLGIPHYVVDMTPTFATEVIAPFVDAYLSGRTPNPCVACNMVVKFGALLDHARALGAGRVATGHYARVAYDADRQQWALHRGADTSKDQTYVLCRLTQAQLAVAVFPLGACRKAEVRAEAEARGLPVARKPDSQEICFIPHNDYRAFVAARAPEALSPGPVREARSGQVLGRHRGLAHYTVGQRRGLALAGAHPWYVVGLDAGANTVLVGRDHETRSRRMTVGQVVWGGGRVPAGPSRATVQIRHRHVPADATVEPIDNTRVTVTFAEPQRAVAPGQTAACYRGDRVLCGGVIEADEPR